MSNQPSDRQRLLAELAEVSAAAQAAGFQVDPTWDPATKSDDIIAERIQVLRERTASHRSTLDDRVAAMGGHNGGYSDVGSSFGRNS